jgi:hypothetical protein
MAGYKQASDLCGRRRWQAREGRHGTLVFGQFGQGPVGGVPNKYGFAFSRWLSLSRSGQQKPKNSAEILTIMTVAKILYYP